MINLRPFCLDDEPRRETVKREALRKPWNFNGYTYASDGAIIVRVPERKGLPIIFINPAGVWKHFPKASGVRWIKFHDTPGVKPDHGVRFGHRLFRGFYLIEISKLPAARVAVDYGGPLDPLPFKFDGGYGLLMPLLSTAEVHAELPARKAK